MLWVEMKIFYKGEKMYKVDELLAFYDQVIGTRVPCYDKMLEVMADFVPDGSNILDIGIFSANLEYRLLQRGKCFSFFGIDLVDSQDFVSKKLQTRFDYFNSFTREDLRECDGEEWKERYFSDDNFDIAVSNLVMHSLNNKKAIFQGIYRWLKKDGMLLLGDKFLMDGTMARICEEKSMEWSKAVKEGMSGQDLEKYEAMWRLYPEEREHLLSMEEHCSILKKIGFKEAVVIYQYYQYGVIYAVK